MKAISINAWEIENNDGETLVFMTPEEFEFIQKYKEKADKEIERLNKRILTLEEQLKEAKNCLGIVSPSRVLIEGKYQEKENK